jgi:hypothetical protein
MIKKKEKVTEQFLRKWTQSAKRTKFELSTLEILPLARLNQIQVGIRKAPPSSGTAELKIYLLNFVWTSLNII